MTTPNKGFAEFEAWASKQQGMNLPDAFAGYNAACANKNARIAELEAAQNKGIDQLEFMLQNRVKELEAMICTDSEDYGIVANAAGWEMIRKLKAPPSEGEIEQISSMFRRFTLGLQDMQETGLDTAENVSEVINFYAKAAITKLLEMRGYEREYFSS